MNPNRPNILLITTDQQRWDALGRLNPAIQTPNLDRLCDRGILFERAYCPSPVCTPSRVSMLTGHYPSKHGCYVIGTSLPEDYPTIPQMLGEHGYFTGLIGKAHFRSCIDPASFEAAPNINDLAFFRGWDGPYHGFEHCQLVIGHTTEQHSRGMHYGAWLEDQGVPVDRYFGPKFPYTGFGEWQLPECWHPSRFVADRTMQAIDKATAQERPFFLWSSFQDPHNPFVVPKPWADMYSPDDVPHLPGYCPDAFDDRAPFYRHAALATSNSYGDDPLLSQTEHGWFTSFGNPFCGYEGTEVEQRTITTSYYGMVSLLDHHIGRILDHLEATGLVDNTLIVFTSDHGEMLGHHGFWWKGLPAFEDVQRVPFIVSHPQCGTPGASSTAFQSLVDLGATFLATANAPVPVGQQGLDQSSSWKNADQAVRDQVLMEFRPLEGPFMQTTLRKEQWKLVVYTQRPEYGELYDLSVDPDQATNLWNNPVHAAKKGELLLALIDAEMEKEGNLRQQTAGA
jgi:uncharacterized sulfatase